MVIKNPENFPHTSFDYNLWEFFEITKKYINYDSNVLFELLTIFDKYQMCYQIINFNELRWDTLYNRGFEELYNFISKQDFQYYSCKADWEYEGFIPTKITKPQPVGINNIEGYIHF